MARAVRERAESWGALTAYVQPGWAAEFPWLVQGVTGRTATPEAERAAGAAELEPTVRAATGLRRLVRVRQVHGAGTVVAGGEPTEEDDVERPAADALVTNAPGVGIAVFVADCVPVFAVDPDRRVAAVVHAGWRGIAAGVLEAAIARAAAEFGSRPADLHLHFGPAICGECYEVGPEVFEALRWPGPGGKGRVDLARVLEARALERGVLPARITRSSFCSRCDRDHFYSYRGEGARAGRMAAVAGLRAPGR